MTGTGWVLARVPRAVGLAVLVALIALVAAAHAYQLAFAVGHLPFA
jgi:hypothetical protein